MQFSWVSEVQIKGTGAGGTKAGEMVGEDRRRPANIQMSDDQVVWLQFLMEKEVEEALEIAVSKGTASPSAVLERWMEFLGSPPCLVWVRFKGVPLQAWHKDIFKLLGDCVGQIVEVDKKTAQKKILREGRDKR